MHFPLSTLQKKLMGFESKFFISAEQFAMSSSKPPSSGGQSPSLRTNRSEVSLLPNPNGEDHASTTHTFTVSKYSSSGGGAANAHRDGFTLVEAK